MDIEQFKNRLLEFMTEHFNIMPLDARRKMDSFVTGHYKNPVIESDDKMTEYHYNEYHDGVIVRYFHDDMWRISNLDGRHSEWNLDCYVDGKCEFYYKSYLSLGFE